MTGLFDSTDVFYDFFLPKKDSDLLYLLEQKEESENIYDLLVRSAIDQTDVPLVSRFGSVGQGKDDTTVIQRAIDSAGLVKLPPKLTCIANQLYLPPNGGILGYTSSTLFQANSSSGPLIQLGSIDNVETVVDGFLIYGNVAHQSGQLDGIFLSNIGSTIGRQGRHRVSNMRFRAISGSGLTVNAQTRSSLFYNLDTYFCDKYGVNNGGADNVFMGIVCAQSGLAGLLAGGTNVQYLGGKLWLNGRLTPANNPGLLFTQSWQEARGFNVQQNYSNGVQVFRSGADILNIFFDGSVDSNNQAAAGYGALNIFRTKNSEFHMRVTDSLVTGPHAYAVGLDSNSINNTISVEGTAYTIPVSGVTSTNKLDFNGVSSSRYPRAVTLGQETIPRGDATTPVLMATGEMICTTFTSKKQESISNLSIGVTTIAAGAPSKSRLALYEMNAAGTTATLVAGTAVDTPGLFLSLNQRIIPTIASYLVKYDTIYIIGALVVTASAGPSILGRAGDSTGSWVESLGPIESFKITGLSDVPASITMASVTPVPQSIFALVTP